MFGLAHDRTFLLEIPEHHTSLNTANRLMFKCNCDRCWKPSFRIQMNSNLLLMNPNHFPSQIQVRTHTHMSYVTALNAASVNQLLIQGRRRRKKTKERGRERDWVYTSSFICQVLLLLKKKKKSWASIWCQHIWEFVCVSAAARICMCVLEDQMSPRQWDALI